jgi:hypothetical protein
MEAASRRDVAAHGRGVGITILATEAERTIHDRGDARRCVGLHASKRRRSARGHLFENAAGRVVLVYPPTRQQSEHHGAEREQIGASVNLRHAARRLLGCHVRSGADRDSRLGHRPSARDARDSEVQDAHVIGSNGRSPLVGSPHEKEIVRLEVAVHDAARMSHFEHLEDTIGDREDVVLAEHASCLSCARAERLAVQKVHRQIDATLVLTLRYRVVVDDSYGARVLDAIRCIRLTPEAFLELGA